MTRNAIESKVSKYLRKANRRKALRLRLEKIKELMEILEYQPLHISSEKESQTGTDKAAARHDATRLKLYSDLCHIHRIKFQMDTLFEGVKREITRFNRESAHMDYAVFEHLLWRLRTVLHIDAYHPEAQAVLETLIAEYPQYAEKLDSSGLYLDITPYQRSTLCIEIACNVTDILQNTTLQSFYEPYQVIPRKLDVTEADSTPEICRLRFFQNQLRTFEIFHEALRTRPTYSITVNRHALDEKFFSAWFHCYKGFLKANTPQYCYGGSPFTFNFFGCHKLFMKDIAKHYDTCWFRYGFLDQGSGLFLVNADQIANHIRSKLSHCGFCPALTQEKLLLGTALLPQYINPEDTARWHYLYSNRGRTGVMPAGHDIAVSLREVDALHDHDVLIEAGATPYIEKILRYLQSEDRAELSETTYNSLSFCIKCGSVYKPHTMTCSRCRTDFYKYALKDLENVLDHLRDTRDLELPPVPQVNISLSKRKPRAHNTVTRQKTVSFSQLWDDPEIRKILSKQRTHSAQETQTEQKEHNATVPDTASSGSPPSISETNFSPRFNLHEKLRSLISKKYREQKAIEQAFSQTQATITPAEVKPRNPSIASGETAQKQRAQKKPEPPHQSEEHPSESDSLSQKEQELLKAVRKLKPRQKSKLSKRGVVRVIYHAIMDKETCPLCHYLDEVVMDPDDPATDIFSPPLYPGCTCSREYVLKTEKPDNWPHVTFRFPPEELLVYLEK